MKANDDVADMYLFKGHLMMKVREIIEFDSFFKSRNHSQEFGGV